LQKVFDPVKEALVSSFMSIPCQACALEDLLGPLNDVEQQHAPATLFVAGDPTILRHGARVAIVGARKTSAQGLARARKLATWLCTRGGVVVSGLAAGIDTAAHQATLAAGGRTIAVLGTPLDQVYPKTNAELQHQIMREHLCLSQFPAGSPIQRHNFPMRNRTMALLSDATVIIEATDTSGSLAQGWEALRLGRGLFIVQSVAEDPALSWPHTMRHYGAQVLSDETLDLFFDCLPHRTEAIERGAIPF
jgi:DNA processing protein